jgi:signal transduction histidine kinase
MAFSTVYLGKANLDLGNNVKALQEAEQALSYLETIQSPELKISANQLKAKALENMGKDKEAIAALHAAKLLADSLYQKEKTQITNEALVKYETQRIKREKDEIATRNELMAKEIKLKSLEAESAKNATQVLALGGLLAFILLGSGAGFWYLKNQQKQKDQLALEREILTRQKFGEVIQAEENERTRIARDLHDGLGHLLSAAKLHLNAIENELAENASIINNATTIIDEAVVEVRAVSHNLMPASLTELGLVSALAELSRKTIRVGNLVVDFHHSPDFPRLASSVEVALYRAAQETLNNMLKHSQAKQIIINLHKTSQKIELQIADNGIGFDTENIKNSQGIGWKSIFSRIEMLQGEVMVNSEKDKGTTVKISV